ncbi:MAG: hypothetical protein Q7R48_00145 [bacterium]|nr:hypothetical protein [bacterium]
MEPIHISKEEETPEGWKCTVEVGHNSEKVGFVVSLTKEYWERLTGRMCDPHTFILKSCQLLLEHVPKVVIRRELRIEDVDDYLPEGEYEEEIQKRIHVR